MSASEAVWNGRFGAFAMAYVLFGIGAEGLKKCVRSAASSQRNGRDGRRGGARGPSSTTPAAARETIPTSAASGQPPEATGLGRPPRPAPPTARTVRRLPAAARRTGYSFRDLR